MFSPELQEPLQPMILLVKADHLDRCQSEWLRGSLDKVDKLCVLHLQDNRG